LSGESLQHQACPPILDPPNAWDVMAVDLYSLPENK
jgi:hypothetical protein